jgi:hypothetical protein
MENLSRGPGFPSWQFTICYFFFFAAFFAFFFAATKITSDQLWLGFIGSD